MVVPKALAAQPRRTSFRPPVFGWEEEEMEQGIVFVRGAFGVAALMNSCEGMVSSFLPEGGARRGEGRKEWRRGRRKRVVVEEGRLGRENRP